MKVLLAWLVAGAEVGAVCRVLLVRASGFDGSPAFSNLWANACGCLFMGFAAAAASSLKKERAAEEKPPGTEEGDRELRSVALACLGGVTTGLCGSMTTFAGWSLDAAAPLVGWVPRQQRFMGSGGDDRGFFVWLTVLWSGAATAVAALHAGRHAFEAVPAAAWPRPRDASWAARAAVAAAAAVAVAAVLVPVATGDEALWATALAAPAGAGLRFALGRRLNGGRALPVGTLVANVCGTAVLAAATVAADASDCAGGGAWLAALRLGFCGSLTTVSSMVLEASRLPRGAGYAYAAGTVAAGQAVTVAVVGVYAWARDGGTRLPFVNSC